MISPMVDSVADQPSGQSVRILQYPWLQKRFGGVSMVTDDVILNPRLQMEVYNIHAWQYCIHVYRWGNAIVFIVTSDSTIFNPWLQLILYIVSMVTDDGWRYPWWRMKVSMVTDDGIHGDGWRYPWWRTRFHVPWPSRRTATRQMGQVAFPWN